MDYKETYEKFWKINPGVSFNDYERNWVLPFFFPKTEKREKIADIAGGSGIVSEWLEKQGYETYLVEFSDGAVTKAKERGLTRIYQQLLDKESPLPFNDNYFDAVFFGDIIEHLFDSESALREVRRVLKPGGKLVISCPNMAYWRFRSYYLVDGDFHRIDVAKQEPWEQEHIRFFNVSILKRYLGKIGFAFDQFKGVNTIWHSKFLANYFPNLFANTIITSFKNKK